MLEAFTAYTGEVDDGGRAAAQVLAQLGLGEAPPAHGVALLACHYEFVFSGAYRAVCEALPYEVAGFVTPAGGAGGSAGTLGLSALVLAGEEDSFATALVPLPGEDGPADLIPGAWGSEGLVLAFAPGGAGRLARPAGRAPCLGVLAADGTPEGCDSYALHNGEYYEDRAALVWLRDASPRFFSASLGPGRVIDRGAKVTRAAGRVVLEIDGAPAADYFARLGLDAPRPATPLPFLLDAGDGAPPQSGVFLSLDGAGVLCAGEVAEGGALQLGVFDPDDVAQGSGSLMRGALDGPPPACALGLSSLCRMATLGGEGLAEIESAQEEAGALPLLAAYGETVFLPVHTAGGWAARPETNALVLCLL